MAETFPLKWPLGRATTKSWQRRDAAFKTTPVRARDELMHELKLLGARNVVISSNVRTYSRGGQEIMYADQSAARDEPGVAIYYTWKDEQYALACDRYKTVMDNLQALNKTINAIRGIERWGTGEMMKAAFAGFKELPSSTADIRSCWEVLGLQPTKNLELIRTAYRKQLFKKHPDHGGTHEAMTELNIAKHQAEQYATT